jgi:hypothetical protein
MLPMEKSVTFTGACANEIIPNGITRSFVNKGKEEGHVRIMYILYASVRSEWLLFNTKLALFQLYDALNEMMMMMMF